MSPSIRTLLTSLLIAAVAPIGLAALDLERPAFAKNGNGGGNGGGHGGGNGGGHGNAGGHGNGNANGHGNANGQAKNADAATETDADTDTDTDTDTETDGLAPNELGKLNGVLHASPNAIAHASINSPIGTARAFGEALSEYLDSPAPEEETEGDEATVEDAPVTVEQLGEMMANMTNKPVTADQVEAVAEKLGINLEDEESEDQPPESEETPEPDVSLAQQIADEANKIHGFTDETDAPDDDTAAAETTEETEVN